MIARTHFFSLGTSKKGSLRSNPRRTKCIPGVDHTWATFSNHSSAGEDELDGLSLETTHDSMHIAVGGGGHMSYVDIAGALVKFQLLC